MPRDDDRPRLRKRPYEALFNNFLRKCKRDGRDCSIVYEDFIDLVKQGKCTYCEELLTWTEFYLNKNGHSQRYYLDRKDNSRGYHRDNVCVCCWNCNQIKSSRLTHEEMLVAMKAVTEHRSRSLEWASS